MRTQIKNSDIYLPKEFSSRTPVHPEFSDLNGRSGTYRESGLFTVNGTHYGNLQISCLFFSLLQYGTDLTRETCVLKLWPQICCPAHSDWARDSKSGVIIWGSEALSVNGFFCFIFPSFFASFFGWRERKNEAKMKVKNPLSRHGVLREVLASFFFPSFFAVGHRAKIFDCYTNSHICIIYYLFLRSDMRNFLGL